MTPRRHVVLTDHMHRELISLVRAAAEEEPESDELRKLLRIVKAAKKVVPGRA